MTLQTGLGVTATLSRVVISACKMILPEVSKAW